MTQRIGESGPMPVCNDNKPARNTYSTYIEAGEDVLPVHMTSSASQQFKQQPQPQQQHQLRPATISNSSLQQRPLLNKAIYIEPSPSGVTRVHINHIHTGGSVFDKVRQVNELAAKQFERSTSGSSVRSRSVSPLSFAAQQQQLLASRDRNNTNSNNSNYLRVNSGGASLLRTGQFNVAGQIQRPYECERNVINSVNGKNQSTTTAAAVTTTRDNCTSPIHVLQSSNPLVDHHPLVKSQTTAASIPQPPVRHNVGGLF
jgi:hypothetical protein